MLDIKHDNVKGFVTPVCEVHATPPPPVIWSTMLDPQGMVTLVLAIPWSFVIIGIDVPAADGADPAAADAAPASVAAGGVLVVGAPGRGDVVDEGWLVVKVRGSPAGTVRVGPSQLPALRTA